MGQMTQPTVSALKDDS